MMSHYFLDLCSLPQHLSRQKAVEAERTAGTNVPFRALEIYRSARGKELTVVQVTPHKPGETRFITDPTTMRCESELQALTAAVNEIDAFIASERQTYLTRLKPGLEAGDTTDGDVWEISLDSDIHMQCLEH